MPRPAILILSALLALSALAGTVAAFANSAAGAWRPAWFTGGFEIVILIASIFGVLGARGRFRQSVSTTLVCIATAAAIGTLFGYLAAGRILMGVNLLPLLLLRLALAAAFVLIAGLIVLENDRASYARLAKGAALLIIGAAIAGMTWFARARIAAISEELLMGAVVAAFCVVTGFIAAGVDAIVKAFQPGIDRAALSPLGTPSP